MPEFLIDVTDPSSYTTQTKLLICQLLYDTLSTPRKFKGPILLDNLKKHPLINHPDMRLDEDQLLRLLNNIMVENELLKDDLPASVEDYRDQVNLIIEACNAYFFKRIKELEEQIQTNKEEFTREYKEVEKSL